MKEKTLFKIAFICTVVGLWVLFFISENLEIEEIDVSKIDSIDIGKEVRVIGRVERITDTEKVAFMVVGQEKIESVSVVLFKDGEIFIEQGDYVELIGKLDDYNGEVNIIANAVKVR